MQPKGHIYFIACGDCIKIGMTTGAPKRRLQALQTASPARLVLLSAWQIKRSRMKGVERILHHALRPFRVSGEWYRLSPSQLAGMAEPLARLVGTKLGDDDPIRVFRQPLPETRFEDFAPVALRDRSEYFWLLSSPPTHQD